MPGLPSAVWSILLPCAPLSGSVHNNTTLNFLDYGEVGHLDVYDTSKVNVLSSTAEVTKLNAHDSSIITISNGTVGLNCWGSSTTTVLGGSIMRGHYGLAVIPIYESSKLIIYGGSFLNDFALQDNGILPGSLTRRSICCRGGRRTENNRYLHQTGRRGVAWSAVESLCYLVTQWTATGNRWPFG